MLEFDTFEQNLSMALRGYADEVRVAVDPDAVTREVRLTAGVRRRWLPQPRPLSSAAWLLLSLVALLVAMTIGVAAVGSWLARDRFVEPGPRAPGFFAGHYLALPSETFGGYVLDPTAPYLLSITPDEVPERIDPQPDAGSRPVEWAGRVVSFGQTSVNRGIATMTAAAPCGDARYEVALNDSGAVTLGAIDDQCVERVLILERTWEPTPVTLETGVHYSSGRFTEPFHFVMPDFDTRTPHSTANVYADPGLLRVGNGYSWWSWFVDDTAVYMGLCEGSALQPLPNTRADFEAWLTSDHRYALQNVVEVEVDGRPVVRFDVVRPPCGQDGTGRSLDYFAPDVRPGTYYLISTPNDVIVYIVNSDGGSTPPDAEVAEKIVRSITFDQ